MRTKISLEQVQYSSDFDIASNAELRAVKRYLPIRGDRNISNAVNIDRVHARAFLPDQQSYISWNLVTPQSASGLVFSARWYPDGFSVQPNIWIGLAIYDLSVGNSMPTSPDYTDLRVISPEGPIWVDQQINETIFSATDIPESFCLVFGRLPNQGPTYYSNNINIVSASISYL